MKYALLGEKLGHSYSRVIHEKYFKIKSDKSSYELIETPKEKLASTVNSLLKGGYSGFNVTIPYKTDVYNMCDELSPEAKKIGSINTVKVLNGKLHGFNTDYYGLKLSLLYNGVSLEGKRVVILGTGGASKAVSALCEDLGCSDIKLVSRSPEPCGKHCIISYSEITGGDVIINTTPVGMYPKQEFSPCSNFFDFKVAVDLIYNPSQTLFLKTACENGLKTVNGLYMLVAQALYSQSIWNNTDADIDAINKIYSEMRGK
ncbi:MAG: shikimate dehydrogenase [Clostridia bacterium]|nr:shikimate dehydrogenase [Clostridia bacterium]